MAKGFNPMGGANMKNMMKQVQKMQKQMEEMQAELDNKEFEGSAGGCVSAKVNGRKELLSVKIDMETVEADDIEMLQDMIVAAVNNAMTLAEEESSKQLSGITGGLNMPGLL